MFHIGLDEAEATETIVNTTRHLPVGMSLGRILAVTAHGILTDGDMFCFDAAQNWTFRIATTPDGGYSERVYWRDGVELGRYVSGRTE